MPGTAYKIRVGAEGTLVLGVQRVCLRQAQVRHTPRPFWLPVRGEATQRSSWRRECWWSCVLGRVVNCAAQLGGELGSWLSLALYIKWITELSTSSSNHTMAKTITKAEGNMILNLHDLDDSIFHIIYMSKLSLGVRMEFLKCFRAEITHW